MRRTKTDIRDKSESEVRDLWYDNDPEKKLTVPWVGTTTFILLRPKLQDGWYWLDGRETRRQSTTRPDSIRPEDWRGLSKKIQEREIDLWKVEGSLRDKARSKRASEAKRSSFCDVPLDDKKKYNEIMDRARVELTPPTAPAMPLIELIKQKNDRRFLRYAASGRKNKHTNHKRHQGYRTKQTVKTSRRRL